MVVAFSRITRLGIPQKEEERDEDSVVKVRRARGAIRVPEVKVFPRLFKLIAKVRAGKLKYLGPHLFRHGIQLFLNSFFWTKRLVQAALLELLSTAAIAQIVSSESHGGVGHNSQVNAQPRKKQDA